MSIRFAALRLKNLFIGFLGYKKYQNLSIIIIVFLFVKIDFLIPSKIALSEVLVQFLNKSESSEFILLQKGASKTLTKWMMSFSVSFYNKK